VKEAASKTSDVAGDGTTTATVLAEAIFKEGYRALTAGNDAMALARGVRKAVDAVVANLKKQSKPIDASRKDDIANVATISANNDREIGQIMADAFARVGRTASSPSRKARASRLRSDVVEGMQFDRGFLSPNFITNPDDMTVELEKALILIYEDKISAAAKLIPLLEKVQKAKKPLLHHRRGRRGRSARDARREQAPRHPQRLRGEGARATAIAARRCSRTSRSSRAARRS
jgi:chaperonin GroEL